MSSMNGSTGAGFHWSPYECERRVELSIGTAVQSIDLGLLRWDVQGGKIDVMKVDCVALRCRQEKDRMWSEVV